MWMKVSKHAVPELGVALVGDAAHSMYSMFGQGCSCGLQGARMLSRGINNPDATSTEAALESFSKESRDEGHAISDLNLLSHWDGTKLLGRLRIWNFMKLFPLLNNAKVSYTSIRRGLWWQVALTRLLWVFQRVSVDKQ
jgi:2-polyprenyl-6-methoxyphenol hydroxylase-like FAD-dependent oxidoreductase